MVLQKKKQNKKEVCVWTERDRQTELYYEELAYIIMEPRHPMI